MPASSADADTPSPVPPSRRRRWRAVWQVLKSTVGDCLRYRVTGLAAECAFFAILSLPPLIFGLAGTLGYVAEIFGDQTVTDVKQGIVNGARQALTEDSVQTVIVPSLDAVLARGRADVISIGFVLALWSGSRALNVVIDTITIMYGLGGRRGIIKTRALSFTMYVVALGVGVIVLPLVLAGPDIVDSVLPDRFDVLNGLYWPTVVVLSTLFLATLYHLAVPVRKPWLHAMAGSALVLVIWVGGSYLLRWSLTHAVGSTSIYGPLAAPIVVLVWLFMIAIAVLIGAAFNAAFDTELDRLREERERAEVAAERVARARASASVPTEGEGPSTAPSSPEPSIPPGPPGPPVRPASPSDGS